MMLYAQKEESNAFQRSEDQATGVTSSSASLSATAYNQAQSTGGPGNLPGDDEIPIDGYLPLLMVVGSTLIVYIYKSEKIESI